MKEENETKEKKQKISEKNTVNNMKKRKCVTNIVSSMLHTNTR